jgi:3-oxoacyl-(acyl-carrier-protein) synthase
MRRVVVTGMGAITPIGLSVDSFWNSVKQQKTGFGPITRFDATEYKAKLAAEVKDFDAKNYMDLASMQWQLRKRLWNNPASIWKRKILSVWDVLWAPVSAAFRQ